MERENNIVKVSRTLIGMDEEHCECDFVGRSKMNGKPAKTC